MPRATTDPTIKRFFLWFSRRGGRTGKGSAKARTTEQCRKAAQARCEAKQAAATALAERKAGNRSAMGRYGGARGTGKAKARTTEQARAAALAGVAKRKAKEDAVNKERTAKVVAAFHAGAREKERAYREKWFTK